MPAPTIVDVPVVSTPDPSVVVKTMVLRVLLLPVTADAAVLAVLLEAAAAADDAAALAPPASEPSPPAIVVPVPGLCNDELDGVTRGAVVIDDELGPEPAVTACVEAGAAVVGVALPAVAGADGTVPPFETIAADAICSACCSMRW